jgi:arginase
MNTPETTHSGNIHGMPLAAALGLGARELVGLGDLVPMVRAENAVLVGVHSIDGPERETIRRSGIRAFAVRDIDMRGMHSVMEEALEIANRGTAGFHLSFDLDGCDPNAAPGVGTPVPGGLTLREAHLIMEHAAESDRLLSLDLAEINPILDQGNRTAELAKELALSALGKSVL